MAMKVPDAEYWAMRVKPSGSTLLTQVDPLPANSRPPAVNWDVWLNMPRVVLWKAVALSLNIEPDEATATGRAFESRMSLAVAHLADGLLRHIEVNDVRRVAFTRVRLVDISRLAASCQWSVPNEFPKAEALPVVVPAQKAITTVPAAIGDPFITEDRIQSKRRTWRDVAWPYMLEVFKAGQYTTAKEFYQALEKKAGVDSPFDRGTGINRDSLFVREISGNLSFKTVQNAAWKAIKGSR